MEKTKNSVIIVTSTNNVQVFREAHMLYAPTYSNPQQVVVIHKFGVAIFNYHDLDRNCVVDENENVIYTYYTMGTQ